MKKITSLMAGSALLGSLFVGSTAFAAENTSMMGRGMMMRPGVVGTVATAPDASGSFTVNARVMLRSETSNASASAIIYTVTTTSSTTVMKNGSPSNVSAIAVGDTVMVQGAKSGTTIAAAVIRDGNGRIMGAIDKRIEDRTGIASSTLPVGNGQPVIGGNLTAVNGSTLTVTNGSVTYTVNAGSATISKPGVASATLASLAVGDHVVVQGSVNGTSVTATSVIDTTATVAPGSDSESNTAPKRSMLGGLGGFFAHLFGF